MGAMPPPCQPSELRRPAAIARCLAVAVVGTQGKARHYATFSCTSCVLQSGVSYVAANVVRYLEKLTFASANKVREARGTWGGIALTVRTGGCCRDECRARWPLSAAVREAGKAPARESEAPVHYRPRWRRSPIRGVSKIDQHAEDRAEHTSLKTLPGALGSRITRNASASSPAY
jgi:hypothetical protein